MKVAEHTYIACWNPDRFHYTLTQQIYVIYQNKLWQRNHDMRWRVSLMRTPKGNIEEVHWGVVYEPDKLDKGDRFFALSTGSPDPSQNVLRYSGFFDSPPFPSTVRFAPDGTKSSPRDVHKVAFSHDTIVYPNYPNKFTVEYLCQRFPDYEWSGMNRGFVLSPEDALALEQEWYDYWSNHDEDFRSDGPLWCQSTESFSSMYEWIAENGQIEHGRAWAYIDYLIKQLVKKKGE